MSDEANRGKDAESVPYHMTTDEARDALAELSKKAGDGAVTVSRDRVNAIAAAFGRLAREHELVRRKAEDFGKRLVSLRGYMERYVDSVEREAICKRDAMEAFQEREVALAELKRIMMEG